MNASTQWPLTHTRGVNVCHRPSLLADCAAKPLEANDGFVFLFSGRKLKKHWSKKPTDRQTSFNESISFFAGHLWVMKAFPRACLDHTAIFCRNNRSEPSSGVGRRSFGVRGFFDVGAACFPAHAGGTSLLKRRVARKLPECPDSRGRFSTKVRLTSHWRLTYLLHPGQKRGISAFTRFRYASYSAPNWERSQVSSILSLRTKEISMKANPAKAEIVPSVIAVPKSARMRPL